MIRIIITIAIFFSSFVVNGQTKPTAPDTSKKQGKVYTHVQQMPEFPGGNKELMKFIGENLKYPDEAKAFGISGRVYVTFVIKEDGDIDQESVTIEQSIGGGTELELKKLIYKMPKWTPGYQDRIAVPVKYRLPVTFVTQ